MKLDNILDALKQQNALLNHYTHLVEAGYENPRLKDLARDVKDAQRKYDALKRDIDTAASKIPECKKKITELGKLRVEASPGYNNLSEDLRSPRKRANDTVTLNLANIKYELSKLSPEQIVELKKQLACDN